MTDEQRTNLIATASIAVRLQNEYVHAANQVRAACERLKVAAAEAGAEFPLLIGAMTLIRPSGHGTLSIVFCTPIAKGETS